MATGQNDYWPVYLSLGNIHNNVWRAHRNRVELLAFLAIPKGLSSFFLTLTDCILTWKSHSGKEVCRQLAVLAVQNTAFAHSHVQDSGIPPTWHDGTTSYEVS